MVSVIFVCKQLYIYFFAHWATQLNRKKFKYKTVWYHPRLTRSCSVVLAVIVTWAVFHKSDRFAHWSASGQKADEKRSSSCKRNCQPEIKKIFLLSKEKKKWLKRGKNQFHFFPCGKFLVSNTLFFETFLEDFLKLLPNKKDGFMLWTCRSSQKKLLSFKVLYLEPWLDYFNPSWKT